MGSLAADLKKLDSLAFHQGAWSADLVKALYRRLQKPLAAQDAALMRNLYDWLLTPVSLWPMNLDALGRESLDELRRKKNLSPDLCLALSLIGLPPKVSAQEAVSQHEHLVQRGDYESLIHADYKFTYKEQGLVNDLEIAQDWKRIKSLFDVRKFQDHKRIIRRQMVQERAFRPYWDLDWKKEEDRFSTVFSAFCLRWNLYGMDGDKPLLLKMTVNLTPFGTMIFVPAYWSFDPKRDLKWRAITALHKARGVGRQGPKLSRNQLEQLDEAEQAQRLWKDATSAGKKGKARVNWIMGQMGWHPATDESRLKRLLKLSRKPA